MPLSVYKSSAGSGKTFTLVREYLKILLRQPTEYRHILALTFTNKATEEMKSRIIVALSQLSRQDPKAQQLADQLLEDPDLHLSPESLQQKTQQSLSNILHNYADFSVKTIDSFFQQILRNFAKELKIPIHFEMEMNIDTVMDYLVTELMLDVGKRPEITQWLEDFVYARIDTDKGWKIEQHIVQLSKEMLAEKVWDRIVQQSPADQHEPAESHTQNERNPTQMHYHLLSETAEQLWKMRKMFENKLKQYGNEGVEYIHGFGLNVADFKIGTASYFQKLADGNIENFLEKSTILKLLEGNTHEWATKTSPLKSKIEQAVNNGLQSIFEESISYYKNNIAAYYSAIEVLKNIYVYGLLFEMKEKLKDYRTDNNKMLMSDTTYIIRRIIGGDLNGHFDDNEVPFVFEKVGLTYKHILLDEFQDTSNYQWKNLLPLVKNALSEDNTALVVGDVKQSIYRWRGGNMHLLLSEIEQDLHQFWKKNTTKNLTHNYRSRTNIVNFNNDFFKAALTVMAELQPNNANLSIAYSDVFQKVQRTEGGFVQISFIDDKKWQDTAQLYTIETIENLHNKGIQYNQIAILTRNNKEGVLLAELLATNNIKVISSISLLLNQSYKIRLLIACLRYLANERDSVARAEILLLYRQYTRQYGSPQAKQQWQNCSLHQIYSDHLMPQKDQSLFQTLLPNAFIDYFEQFAKLSLYETLEHLIRTLQLHIEPDIYIQRFQDLVLEHHNKQSNDLQDFLRWWQQHENSDKCSIIVPKGEDAVTIMTIHKAKGLEFPIVIIPFADWSLYPNPQSTLWTGSNIDPFDQLGIIPVTAHEQLKQSYFAPDYEQEVSETLIDNMNLLYVALTRPTDELYLFAPAYKEKSKDNKINRLHKLLFLSLQSPNFEDPSGFDPSNNTYSRGQSIPQNISSPITDDVSILQRYICEDYTQRITIKSDIRQHNIVLGEQPTDDSNIDNILLEILEKTKQIQQIDATIRRLHAQGTIKNSQIPNIKQHLQQITELPLIQHWFGQHWDKVLTQRAILNHSKKRVPARILLQGKQAILIDYKTGEIQPKHTQQINEYDNLLLQMGYHVTEKYLLYIHNKHATIVAVD